MTKCPTARIDQAPPFEGVRPLEIEVRESQFVVAHQDCPVVQARVTIGTSCTQEQAVSRNRSNGMTTVAARGGGRVPALRQRHHLAPFILPFALTLAVGPGCAGGAPREAQAAPPKQRRPHALRTLRRRSCRLSPRRPPPTRSCSGLPGASSSAVTLSITCAISPMASALALRGRPCSRGPRRGPSIASKRRDSMEQKMSPSRSPTAGSATRRADGF